MPVDATSGRATFGGIATGLDTNALIDGLMGIERRPLVALQKRRDDLGKERSLLRDFNTKLLALRDAARALDNRSDTLAGAASAEELLAYKATTSKDAVATATATGNASPGTYSLRVEALARVGRRISNPYVSKTTTIASAGQTFTVGHGGPTDIAITIGAGGASLEQLRDLVNTDANNGGKVRAEVLFDGASYRLVVSGAETGALNDVDVTTDIPAEGGGAFLDATKTQAALDARLVVLGVTVTRPTNDVSDAIPGVSLKLVGTNSATDANDALTLTVTRDDDAIAKELESFVKAYNDVRDFLTKQSGTKDQGSAGPLSGDSTLRTVERLVQTAVGARYAFGASPFSELGEVGVGFDSSGRLKLDRSKLTKALDRDASAVRTLLSGNGVSDGAASALGRALETVVRTGDGMLASRDKGYDRNVRGLDDQISRLDRRLSERETSLRARFTALESLVATLQSQSQFLSSTNR